MNPKYKDEYKRLGKNIAFYRRQARLTQEGLAMKANLSRGYLSQIEAENVKKAPSLEMLFNIAYALKVPVYRLFVDRD